MSISYDILVSPVQQAFFPDEGEFFQVLRSDGGISTPNGVHTGSCSCEGTRNSYFKKGVQEAEDMDEFNLLRSWYLKIMPSIIFSIADGVEFSVRNDMKDLIRGFPQ